MTALELEKMGSQVIVPKMYCLESAVCGHHICKRVWTPLVGEKLCRYQKNMVPMIQGQLQFEHIFVIHVPKACSHASNINEGF